MHAGAKINLMLHITGRREDGYHLLQSLVMFAEYGDALRLEPDAAQWSLETSGEFAAALEGENLISKAAQALASASQVAPHGHLHLQKNLPVGAGLGGGSADAAAALQMLAKYWRCDVKLLPKIAASLGSDITACLHQTPLWMEGTGNDTRPVSIDFDLPLLLVNPRCFLPTAQVYQRVMPPYNPPLTLPDHFESPAALLSFLHATSNDLEPPAIGMKPEVGAVLAALRGLRSCQFARMSGSGATCFGIFEDRDACARAAEYLQSQHPDWWIQATMLKGSHHG